jgi:NADPH:quinone reductase-like Zn-dependent oxidoreductase
MRKADPFAARLFNGLFKPRRIKILGFELSGIVEETGANVTRFKKGDTVLAGCGFKFGAYAEYKCLPEDGDIVLKPTNINFNEAAAIPVGATTALRFLKSAEIKSEQSILIYGASGSVGTYAVQLAKHFGARVTGVCSTGNVNLIKSLGAETVIDYTKEEFLQGKAKYDIIFDAVGKLSKSKCRNILNPNGKFISAHGSSKEKKDNLAKVVSMVEAGYIKPIIDKVYPFEEIPDAHRYVETFRKKGNVVVSLVN